MTVTITPSAPTIGTGSVLYVPFDAWQPGDFIQAIIISDSDATPFSSGWTKVMDLPGEAEVFQRTASTAGSNGSARFNLAVSGDFLAWAEVVHVEATPGPSEPGGGSTDPRQGLILGVDKPASATTGVPAGTVLTPVTAHTPVSGAEYSDLDILVDVNLAGTTGVKYRRCRLRGNSGAGGSGAGLVRATGNHGGGHVFEDCTFDPQTPHHNRDGIRGWGFTLRRCDISGVVDGVSVFNTSTPSSNCAVTIEQCWIHDQAYWPNPPDTNHSDGSHCDGVQWQGSPGLVVRGNLISGVLRTASQPGQFGTKHTNSCMMIKPDAGPIGSAVIEGNWFYGANIGININHDAPDRYISNLGTLTGNRFDHDQRGQGGGGNDTWTVLKPTSTAGTFTGNVYEDNGAAVRIRTQ